MKVQKSLKEQVYQSILDGIISDEYKSNEIITEKALIDKYQVSKSPIREALIALCNEGVIRSIPRCGYEVIRITRENVKEILKFRSILEKGCMQQCYKTLTAEQIEQLIQYNIPCCDVTAGDDMWTHWDYNQKFHLKLISYANNSYAYKELKQSMDILKRAYAQFYWDKWNTTIVASDMRSHAKLIQSLEKKDIEQAMSCLDLDLQDFGY
ncbi:GntR family transcriptional regulator [Lachnospiraceae bacterium LCP25S3_G4]